MPKSKELRQVTQGEFTRIIKLVEENTCFRIASATDARSAFMVPVAQDGKTPIGPCIELSWKQLKGLSELKEG